MDGTGLLAGVFFCFSIVKRRMRKNIADSLEKWLRVCEGGVQNLKTLSNWNLSFLFH